MSKESIEVTEAAQVAVFSRDQILASQKLQYSPDILRTVLRPGQQYSLAEVEQRVKDFMGRVV